MAMVVFPDGSRVRASSIVERKGDDPERAFGLYLDPRWNPTWREPLECPRVSGDHLEPGRAHTPAAARQGLPVDGYGRVLNNRYLKILGE
ncbi:MAG TPA: hypothetical protein VIW19_09495 [Gaiellaceae bacterium]